MKRNSAFLVILLVILSIFTYIKTNELKETRDENISLKIKIDEQNYEYEKLKNKYRIEYEIRNLVDIKARGIYDALMSSDIDYLKTKIAMGVLIDNDNITFENGNLYSFSETSKKYSLRQRYFELSEDNLSFITGYEVIVESVDSITICIMAFTYQENDWKLSNIYFDV